VAIKARMLALSESLMNTGVSQEYGSKLCRYDLLTGSVIMNLTSHKTPYTFNIRFIHCMDGLALCFCICLHNRYQPFTVCNETIDVMAIFVQYTYHNEYKKHKIQIGSLPVIQ